MRVIDDAPLTDLLAVLGASPEDARLRRLVADYGLEADRDGDRLYLESEPNGLTVLCRDDAVITIFLFAEGKDGFAQYTGALVEGLTLDSTRLDVRRSLGDPTRVGSASGRSFAGGGWDKYEYGAHSIHFTYDDAQRVELVTLAPVPE